MKKKPLTREQVEAKQYDPEDLKPRGSGQRHMYNDYVPKDKKPVTNAKTKKNSTLNKLRPQVNQLGVSGTL